MAAATSLQISTSATPLATPQPIAVMGELVGLFSHTEGGSQRHGILPGCDLSHRFCAYNIVAAVGE